jgi:hypothetical protein
VTRATYVANTAFTQTAVVTQTGVSGQTASASSEAKREDRTPSATAPTARTARANPARKPPNAHQAQTERNPKSAANLFSQPVTPPPITVSRQPREQARSVSRVFRVRCHIVTC